MQNTLLDLTILTLLLVVFASLYRVRYERRLRNWLLAWLFVLLHFVVLLWSPATPSLLLFRENLHFDLLLLVGVSIFLSCLPASCTMRRRAALVARINLPAMLLIFLATVHPAAVPGMCLCIAIGQGSALYRASRKAAKASPSLRLTIQTICVASAIVMFFSAMRGVAYLPSETVSQLFLIDAFLLWSVYPRKPTTGLLTTCTGLIAWAAVYPLSVLMDRVYTTLVVSTVLWNIPKFLVAFGMILVVLEEDVVRAKKLTDEYRMLFAQHPLPMWVFHNETLRFLKVNDAAILHYGYSREEFATMSVEDLRPPESPPRLRQVPVAEQIATHRSDSGRHVLKGGGMIDADAYSHFIHFEDQPARIVVAVDVTERKAAEERLRQAYKLESLGQLTGGIAHDFNNLLAITMGNLELLDERLHDAASRELVQQAVASVRRGAELTQRLLAYARQQPLAPRLVSIDQLVSDCEHFIRRSLGSSISLQVMVDTPLWHAEIDPGQLENALLNLAINARDAMHAGESMHAGDGPGQGGSLILHCRNLHLERSSHGLLGEIGAGDYVLITIADTGSGMTRDVLQRATEPFFTTKAVGEGTGLGLSMVYGFLKQSGGHLQIESQPGVGTTILLYLPRAHADAEAASPVPVEQAKQPLPRGTERILVVEDEAPIRGLLLTFLSSLGYTVLEAEDGHAAMVHLHATPEIDLLLTDIVLPKGISGALLATGARIIQPAIKVLFSSGYTRNVLTRNGHMEEGLHLLTKPFHLAELAATTRAILDQKPLP